MATEKLINLGNVIRKLEDEIKGCPAPDPEDPPAEVFAKRVIPKLVRDVIDYLKNQPTVDAVEVVHGRWIKKAAYNDGVINTVTCSACGDFQPIGNWDYYNYCPYCGAKMDGERRINNEEN